MRLREAVASALHLLVVAAFSGITIFLFFLPSKPLWRSMCVQWLLEHPEKFYPLAAAFGSAACLFLFGFFTISRGRFLRILMKPHEAIIDAKLLKEAAEECFRSYFSKEVYGVDVAVAAKQRLDIAVDMHPVDANRRSCILREMEKQLTYLLRQRFGYTQSFTLSVRSK
jgi:hypothetical protein